MLCYKDRPNRLVVNVSDVLLFRNSQSLLQMIELTLMDSSYVLKIMYELNVLPLALQITAICGNVMVIDIQIYKKNLNFGLENILS